MAHLVNQMVAGDILALQLLTLLLEKPTDDSVEIAVGFVQECGKVRCASLCGCDCTIADSLL